MPRDLLVERVFDVDGGLRRYASFRMLQPIMHMALSASDFGSQGALPTSFIYGALEWCFVFHDDAFYKLFCKRQQKDLERSLVSAKLELRP